MTFTSVIVAATLPLIGSAFKVNNSELGLVLATYVAWNWVIPDSSGIRCPKIGGTSDILNRTFDNRSRKYSFGSFYQRF